MRTDGYALGWVGCHRNGAGFIGLRVAFLREILNEADLDVGLVYGLPVQFWGSGIAVARHGKAQIDLPGAGAPDDRQPHAETTQNYRHA